MSNWPHIKDAPHDRPIIVFCPVRKTKFVVQWKDDPGDWVICGTDIVLTEVASSWHEIPEGN